MVEPLLAAPLPARSVAARRLLLAVGPNTPGVRVPVDPLSVLANRGPGWVSSTRSLALARNMSIVAGDYAEVVDRYLEEFSKAPPDHLKSLSRRGALISFGPTILDGARSAASQRGRLLSSKDYWDIYGECSERTGTLGIYDVTLDAIVLPTHYRGRDIEHVVMHELGHAITRDATIRRALLAGLPREIALRLVGIGDDQTDPREQLRIRALEALADGYAFLACGREEELPPDLLSELSFILSAVAEGDDMRFDFEGQR